MASKDGSNAKTILRAKHTVLKKMYISKVKIVTH